MAIAPPLPTARVFISSGAPTSGSDGTNSMAAQVGDLLVDTAGAHLYVCTGKVEPTGFRGSMPPDLPAHLPHTAPSITWTQIT